MMLRHLSGECTLKEDLTSLYNDVTNILIRGCTRKTGLELQGFLKMLPSCSLIHVLFTQKESLITLGQNLILNPLDLDPLRVQVVHVKSF